MSQINCNNLSVGYDGKAILKNINFSVDNKDLEIATTRPEFLGGCVAIFVNPNDERYKDLIGKTATVPLYNNQVPIIADEKVAIDKGTGVVMCCTFGDQTDIEWWKKYNLPLKYIFTNDGKIIDSVPNYDGLKIKEAKDLVNSSLASAANGVSRYRPSANEVSKPDISNDSNELHP